jgi:hypothetical protein
VLNNVDSKEEFVSFIYDLRDSYKKDPSMWENVSIEGYLSALAGAAEDFEGYYLNTDQEVPKDINWSLFAHLLDSARIYD